MKFSTFASELRNKKFNQLKVIRIMMNIKSVEKK